jgi:hypothetical protein
LKSLPGVAAAIALFMLDQQVASATAYVLPLVTGLLALAAVGVVVKMLNKNMLL